MRTLLAVLQELQYFVLVERFGWVTPNQTGTTTAPKEPLIPVFKKTSPTAELDKHQQQFSHPNQPRTVAAFGEQVFVSVPKAYIYIFPTITIDGVLAVISFGTPLLVRERRGNWLNVRSQAVVGWVTAEAMTSEAAAVLPQLQAGIHYSENDSETQKLRRFIDDEFFGQAGGYPLLDIEYVFYRLTQEERSIIWPATRPRIAGTWQTILKGQTGIYISIEPRTGTVLERVFQDGTGLIGYVTAVYPNQSLQLSWIEPESEGCYCEEILKERQWRGWRPVFISVS